MVPVRTLPFVEIRRNEMTKEDKSGCLHFLTRIILPFGLYAGGLWTATAYGLWLPGGAPADNPPWIAVIGGWVALIGFFGIFVLPFNLSRDDHKKNEEK